MWQYIVLHQLFSNFFIDVNRWIIKTCILVNNLLRRFTNHQTFLIFLIHISISCPVILVPSSQDEWEGQYSVFTTCDVCGPSHIFVVWLELGKIGGKAPLEGAFFCKTNKKLWLHQLKDTPIQCQFVGPCNNIFYKLVTKHSWKTFVPCFAFFVITWSGRCVPLWMEAAVNIVCRASSSKHRAQLGAGTAATSSHPRVPLG